MIWYRLNMVKFFLRFPVGNDRKAKVISNEIFVKIVAIIAFFTYCNSVIKVVRYKNINTIVCVLWTSVVKKRRNDYVKSL